MLSAVFTKTIRPTIDRWIDQRIPAQSGTYTLHRRSIYIVPTRFGFMFGLILIAMLVGSINYEINLGFILTFLFSAIMFIGMLRTYKNISGLQFSILPIDPCFAEQPITIKLQTTMPSAAQHVCFTLNDQTQFLNVQANAVHTLQLNGQARGEYHMDKMKISTIYPLGLFVCWSWLKPAGDYLIYPAPKALPHKIPPPTNVKLAGEQSSSQAGDDELFAFRPYHEGDPINRIAWKKTAQTGKLHSQERSKLVTEDYYIQWDDLHFADTEHRLSMMCQLILDAHKSHTAYGLVMPNEKVAPDHNEQHKHHCLSILARYNPHG